MKNIVLLSFLCLATSISSFGQKIEYGLGLGGMTYWGDLNAPEFSKNISNLHFAIQGVVKKDITPYLNARVNLMYGTVSGDDELSSLEWQKQRNFDFNSTVVELAVMGELHVLEFATENDYIFSPYLVTGIGGFAFNPTTIYQGNKVELQPLGTEGQGMPGFADKYSKIALAIPFGGGAQYKFSEMMSLNLDIIARRTMTDYLDDVSDKYVSYAELAAGNGALAASLGNRTGEYLGQAEPIDITTGAKRGGAKVDDYYITFMATLTFNLNGDGGLFGRSNSKILCPEF